MQAEVPLRDFNQVWQQTRLPAFFLRAAPEPLLVRLPYSPDNKVWLKNDQRNKPTWHPQHGAWEIPRAWFERTIRLSLQRHKACYVIQLYRTQEICAPACWNASGIDCECTCMGANHGGGRPGGRWYEVNETFAVRWGVQRYSVRHITAPKARQIPQKSAF